MSVFSRARDGACNPIFPTICEILRNYGYLKYHTAIAAMLEAQAASGYKKGYIVASVVLAAPPPSSAGHATATAIPLTHGISTPPLTLPTCRSLGTPPQS